jgi:ABC-2 type transport system permease protein
VNRDNHQLSEGLLDYLETMHNLIPMEDDIEVLENAVFSLQAQYILIIDEGFGEQFSENIGSGIWYISTPINLNLSIIIRRQIDNFLQTVMGYTAAGFEYDEAISLAKQDQSHLVTLLTTEGTTVSMFFTALVYLFKSLIVMTLGFVLMVFREKDLASRLEVSPTSPSNRTLWLTIACASTALAMWLLVMIPAFFLHHESLFSPRGILHMLNSLVVAIVCVCIGVLLTRVVKSEEALVRICTLIAMLSGFTGGAFMQVDQMNEVLQTISRFVPAYWYGQSNLILLLDFMGFEVNMSEFWLGIGIQLCFAAALFAVALVIGREKEARE